DQLVVAAALATDRQQLAAHLRRERALAAAPEQRQRLVDARGLAQEVDPHAPRLGIEFRLRREAVDQRRDRAVGAVRLGQERQRVVAVAARRRRRAGVPRVPLRLLRRLRRQRPLGEPHLLPEQRRALAARLVETDRLARAAE